MRTIKELKVTEIDPKTGLTTYIHVDVPMTKDNFTFTDFLIEKYEEGLFIGYKTSQEEGARWPDFKTFLNECDLNQELDDCDCDFEASLKEYNEFFEEGN